MGDALGARLSRDIGALERAVEAKDAYMRLAVLLVLAIVCAMARLATADPPYPATFSIVAADPETGEVGVAVASRFFAVGSVVPYAKAGVGAVATQAFANTTYGPRGLELLRRGSARTRW